MKMEKHSRFCLFHSFLWDLVDTVKLWFQKQWWSTYPIACLCLPIILHAKPHSSLSRSICLVTCYTFTS